MCSVQDTSSQTVQRTRCLQCEQRVLEHKAAAGNLCSQHVQPLQVPCSHHPSLTPTHSRRRDANCIGSADAMHWPLHAGTLGLGAGAYRYTWRRCGRPLVPDARQPLNVVTSRLDPALS